MLCRMAGFERVFFMCQKHVVAVHELAKTSDISLESACVFGSGCVHGKQGVLVQVVEVLTDSLTLPETPVPSKAARLLLVSDVLHNRCCLPPLMHASWPADCRGVSFDRLQLPRCLSNGAVQGRSLAAGVCAVCHP